MDELAEKAKVFVRKNKKLIISKFASLDKYPPVEDPLTFFMAGSPGAGKTEYSKGFMENLEAEEGEIKIVRIDADEIKEIIPGYDKANSAVMQGAASMGVEPLFDHVLHKKQNFILDGTFANYQKARSNIERCLSPKYHRRVGIIYVYLEPEVAWMFTKKREKLEGRPIPGDVFINDFFLAKENVQKIKDEFGKKVHITMVIKDKAGSVLKTPFEVIKIDSYIKKKYTKAELEKIVDKIKS